MVVLWWVDGEKCGKCGLLMVVFFGGMESALLGGIFLGVCWQM